MEKMKRNKRTSKKKKHCDDYNLFNIDNTILNGFNEDYSQDPELATILKYKYQQEDIKGIEANLVDKVTTVIKRFKEDGFTVDEVHSFMNKEYVRELLEKIQYFKAITDKVFQQVYQMIDTEY